MINSDGGESSTCEKAAGVFSTEGTHKASALHDNSPDDNDQASFLRQSPSRSYVLPPDDFNESFPEIGHGWTVDERKCPAMKAEQNTQNDGSSIDAESSFCRRKTAELGDSSGEISCKYPLHVDTQQVEAADADVDAKTIAQTLIELSNATPSIATTINAKGSSNAKHSPALKKKKAEDTGTGTTSKRKYTKLAAGSLKTGDNDRTDVAEALIGMTMIGSTAAASAAQAPSESATEPVTKNNKQRGMSRSEATWNRRFAELRQFKEIHGHTNVPQKYEKNPSLGAWVARNRLFMRQWEENPSGCSDYQVQRMEALKGVGLVSGIGKGGFGRTTGVFLSSRNARDWENQFESLKQYRATHGNCDVPVKSDTHRSLGRWISAQRRKYQQYFSKGEEGKPSNDLLHRFQQLKDIGFNFSIGSGNAKRDRSTATIEDDDEDEIEEDQEKTDVLQQPRQEQIDAKLEKSNIPQPDRNPD